MVELIANVKADFLLLRVADHEILNIISVQTASEKARVVGALSGALPNCNKLLRFYRPI